VKTVGCFITPHGLGHASRAIAVVEALQQRHENLQIRILTTVPSSIFAQNLRSFSYHPILVDVGLVQRSALAADLDATLAALDRFLPFPPALIDECAEIIRDCQVVLCDIAPLGIIVAERLGIPAVLVENFTWDWLYQSYLPRYPQLTEHCRYLREIFHRAHHHIQTEPLCRRKAGSSHLGPIFRRSRGGSEELRRRFAADSHKLIVVTMGGIDLQLPSFSRFNGFSDYTFVFTGQNETLQATTNVLLLDRRSTCYHPDLMAAADAVICKAGYSSLAECYQAGARVISVGRDDFAETEPLQRFVRQELDGMPIAAECYTDGSWLELLPELLQRDKKAPAKRNGADQVADVLLTLIS
jgi:UDP:flavonoid glycosyltransferase YjiC (YdhE family)